MKERCLHRADTSSLLYNYEKFAPQLGRKNYPPMRQKKSAYFPTTASLLPKGNVLTSQRRRAYFPEAARIVLREKSLIPPIFFRNPFLQRTFSMGEMLLIPHLSLP